MCIRVCTRACVCVAGCLHVRLHTCMHVVCTHTSVHVAEYNTGDILTYENLDYHGPSFHTDVYYVQMSTRKESIGDTYIYIFIRTHWYSLPSLLH